METNADATISEVEDTGNKVLEIVPEATEPPLPEQKTEKKEEKITKCPDDVPSAIFECLATMTECERLKLTKEEAARMSEAITQLFGKHLGGWMWWALILVISVLGKLAGAWQCLNKKKEKKEQKINSGKENITTQAEESKGSEDMVEVPVNGRMTTMSREAARSAGLIKAAEA